MVVIMLVSTFAGKLSKKVSNNTIVGYLLAGQSMPWWLIAFMVAGIAVGGASTVGVAQNAYTSGMSAAWYTASWAFGGLIFGFFIAKKVRQYAVTTVSEFFERAFGKQEALIATIAQVVILFGVSAAQITAGGAIICAVVPSISYELALTVSAFVFFIISFFGGYFGASVANVINVIVIYVGLIVAVILSASTYGDVQVIAASLPEGDQWFNLILGMGPAIIIGWFITMAFTTPANQMMYQAAAAAKNERHAKLGIIAGSILMISVGFISAYLGVVGASQFSGIESSTVLPVLIVSLGPVLAGVCLAGLWAADVSTAVSLLLGVSTICTKDIAMVHIKPDMTEKQQLILSKVFLVITISLGLLLAMNLGSIITFLMSLHTLFAPFTIIVLAVLYAPQTLKKSTCMAVMLVGIAAMLAWIFIPATQVLGQAIYLVAPASFATFALCFIFDKRPFNQDELFLKTQLKQD